MELETVGYFSKTHGLKGHLVLRADRDFYIDETKVVFTDSQTGKAPHFITEIKEANSGLIVLMEDIDVVEKARAFIGKRVYIDKQLIAETEDEFEWAGFELIDKQHGSLGKIEGMSDNGEQVLLNLKYKGKELILPLVEEFIEKIDQPNKKLFYTAPEGLIELYL